MGRGCNTIALPSGLVYAFYIWNYLIEWSTAMGMELWRQLGDQLQTQVEISLHPDRNSPIEAQISFTVANTAGPESVNSPYVVFNKVNLTVRCNQQETTYRIDRLEPQQSQTLEFKCKPADLPFVEHSVRGTVDAEAFFKVTGRPARIRSDTPGLPKTVYLVSLDQTLARVQVLVDQGIKTAPAPDATWTLGQIQQQRQRLAEISAEVGADFARTNAILGWVQERDRQQLLGSVRDAVQAYARLIEQGLARLAEAYQAGDARQVQSAAHHATEQLERQRDALAGARQRVAAS